MYIQANKPIPILISFLWGLAKQVVGISKVKNRLIKNKNA